MARSGAAWAVAIGLVVAAAYDLAVLASGGSFKDTLSYKAFTKAGLVNTPEEEEEEHRKQFTPAALHAKSINDKGNSQMLSGIFDMFGGGGGKGLPLNQMQIPGQVLNPNANNVQTNVTVNVGHGANANEIGNTVAQKVNQKIHEHFEYQKRQATTSLSPVSKN